MKSLLQITTPFLFTFSLAAIALPGISKDLVNQKITALIAPYNSTTTGMSIDFTDLKVEPSRISEFALTAKITKIAAENRLTFVIPNAKYQYGPKPSASGDVTLQLDLVKAFGQETLNEFGSQIDAVAIEIVKEYGKKYGDALSAKATMQDLKMDSQGNVQSVRLQIIAAIDFKKLPTNLKSEEVEFQSIQANLAANHQGATGKIQIMLNPLHKDYAADASGLKDFMDKLLSNDKAAEQDVIKMADSLNNFAEWLVNQKPEFTTPRL